MDELKGFTLVITDRKTGHVERVDAARPDVMQFIRPAAEANGIGVGSAIRRLVGGDQLVTAGFIRSLVRTDG